MRTPIVAGNWKMHKTAAEARELISSIAAGLSGEEKTEIVVCPPFTALAASAEAVEDTPIRLGAQNINPHDSGAYTGEIAPGMLKEHGVTHAIIAHSERRQYYGETNASALEKVKAALTSGLVPIYCVGETLEQREAGETAFVVERQVREGLAGIPADAFKILVIAYEPVWAIGTGRTATSEQAQEVHALIRATVSALAGVEAADAVRIQYGGSVKPANAAEIFAQPDVDGGLIGGAALEAKSFVAIVQAAG